MISQGLKNTGPLVVVLFVFELTKIRFGWDRRPRCGRMEDKMELSAITGLMGVTKLNSLEEATRTGSLTPKAETVDGTLFDAFLNTAIDNIKTTNSYLSDAEDEEIKFALGETENTHDLTIALQKASTALQYTVAVRDKLLEAYKELMQMQI